MLANCDNIKYNYFHNYFEYKQSFIQQSTMTLKILLTLVANAQSFCWDQLVEDTIVFYVSC